MQGTLFKFGPGSAQLAFKAHGPASTRQLVLVGGLTDGLLFAPYVTQLAAEAGRLGWGLVQAQLTSSYQVGVQTRGGVCLLACCNTHAAQLLSRNACRAGAWQAWIRMLMSCVC